MLKHVLIYLVACLIMSGCASQQQSSTNYPRKASAGSERKSGPAMSFYEQAEKDMDIADEVIVTPPSDKKKESLGLKQQ